MFKSNSALKLMGAFVLALLAITYISVNIILAKNEKLSNTSIFSDDGSGLSLFRALGEKLKSDQPPESGNPIEISQDVYLDDKILSKYNVIALFSPVAPISERETKLFKTYVENGGTLIVSFHTEDIWDRNLKDLKKTFSVKAVVKPWKEFQNGLTTDVQAKEDIGFFKKDEIYSFYSSLRFTDLDSLNRNLSDYVFSLPKGKGTLLLLAGLPVISNGLINRRDNSKFSFRLIQGTGTIQNKILVDEYHHFFSSKTFSDLLAYPPFILPVCGLLFGLILFFFFAYSEFYEPTHKTSTSEGRSYHDLSENILANFVNRETFKNDIFSHLIIFTRNIFPERQRDFSDFVRRLKETQGDARQKIMEIIRYHQNALRRKGRRQ